MKPSTIVILDKVPNEPAKEENPFQIKPFENDNYNLIETETSSEVDSEVDSEL